MVSAEWKRKGGRAGGDRATEKSVSAQSSGCHCSADISSSSAGHGLGPNVTGLFVFRTGLQRLGAEGLSYSAVDSVSDHFWYTASLGFGGL